METIVIAAVLAMICPLFTFVIAWWTSAALGMLMLPVSERAIQVAALAGLGAGVLADVFFLKRWMATVYTAHWAWVAVVYLGLFLIAFATFMGMPLGTYGVGIMGGIYLGRRLRYEQAPETTIARILTRGGLCAGALTTLFALPVGLMALHEPMVVEAAGVIGLTPRTISGEIGQAAMIIVCAALFALQFYSTRTAGRLAVAWPGHTAK